MVQTDRESKIPETLASSSHLWVSILEVHFLIILHGWRT